MLELSLGSGLGGLVALQSALLLYQHRKIQKYKRDYRRLQERLHQSRKTDEISGAWNYPFFVKRANLAIKKARKERKPVSMILVDIENLERINLRYSFSTGNALLRHLHTRLKKIVGGRGFVGRFGGSGFFVLLENCNEEETFALQERIYGVLTDDPYELRERKIPCRVAISGVTMHGKQISLNGLLEAVESALDEVKRKEKGFALADRAGRLLKSA